MGLTEDRIKDFEQRKAKLETLGGEKLVAKQHQLGKLTARERIDLFFDKGTFQEIQLFVKHRSQAVRAGQKRDQCRRRDHRLRRGKRPYRVRGGPGLHERRRQPWRDACEEDLEGHGHGDRRQEALRCPQRLGRRPYPGRRPGPRRLRRNILPQHDRLRVYPPDHGYHGTHRRRSGLLPRPYRLGVHGKEFELHVHHRPGCHQGGHRRGSQP